MTRAVLSFVGVCALSFAALLPVTAGTALAACPGGDTAPKLCPDGDKKAPAPAPTPGPSSFCPGGGGDKTPAPQEPAPAAV